MLMAGAAVAMIGVGFSVGKTHDWMDSGRQKMMERGMGRETQRTNQIPFVLYPIQEAVENSEKWGPSLVYWRQGAIVNAADSSDVDTRNAAVRVLVYNDTRRRLRKPGIRW